MLAHMKNNLELAARPVFFMHKNSTYCTFDGMGGGVCVCVDLPMQVKTRARIHERS